MVPRRVHVEQPVVGAPVRLPGAASDVADLLEQLLRGAQEPGAPQHGRVAREGAVWARGYTGRELPPRRGRRVRGRRGERERKALARDLSPGAGRQRMGDELRVRQRAVRRVGRRGRGSVGVEGRGRRPRGGRWRARRVGREPQLLASAVLRHVVELPRGLAEQQVLVVVVVVVLGAAAPVPTARRRGHVSPAHERRGSVRTGKK